MLIFGRLTMPVTFYPIFLIVKDSGNKSHTFKITLFNYSNGKMSHTFNIILFNSSSDDLIGCHSLPFGGSPQN